MAMHGTRARDNGRLADFVETLSMLVVGGALLGLAFVVAALLLGWATTAVAEEAKLQPMQRDEARSGTLLFKAAASGVSYAAPLLETEVSMQVSGMVARVHVRQRFTNPGPEWYEGVYVFPLPENAAVDGLRMRVGERVIHGQIKERAEAKAVYEQAKQNGQRAALVEQERPNIFTSSVANIAPNDSIVVEIDYQQNLRYDQGSFSLRFPMVVGPRYIPGTALSEGAAESQMSGWSPNTDQVPDASRITPPVLSPRSLGSGTFNPVKMDIQLNAGIALATVRSPTHDIDMVLEDEHGYRIGLRQDTVPANRDFELIWTPAAGSAPQAAAFHQVLQGQRYAQLMLLPPNAKTPVAPLPREVVFVIDTSGSMDGTSIVQAKEALLLALKGLHAQDRFNVIEFNSVTRPLFSNALPATPQLLERAAAWVSRLQANGGTEIAAALEVALNRSDDPRVLRQVIFLTDGSVGNEEALFKLIGERLGDSRLFTIGIGSAPNSYFMSKAAETGRGSFTYIGNVNEVAQKMGALFNKLEAPVLKNIKIDWPAGAEAWPAKVPDLYAGEPLMVSVKLPIDVQQVRVSGERNGQPWETQLSLRHAKASEGVAKLWARSKIAALLDTERGGANADDVRKGVVEIALQHGLVSKHTSLVAVELKPARTAGLPLRSGAMPTHLPEGWVEESVFGELPQTATAAQWHLFLGLLALAVASVLTLLQGRRMRGVAV
ncbi:MAG TPA: marine proteobacterial sortase target protein [Burkholderiales bacterium]|nr:marine proteobacterial sortase target protein [Burkholderiales bacterium]